MTATVEQTISRHAWDLLGIFPVFDTVKCITFVRAFDVATPRRRLVAESARFPDGRWVDLDLTFDAWVRVGDDPSEAPA